MNLYPRSILGRFISIVWLSVCVANLAYDLWPGNISEPDIAIAFGWTMIILTFPIGYGLGALIGFLSLLLYKSWGITIPRLYADLIVWTLFVPAGYFQWFVLVPWLFRKAARGINTCQDGN
jgi:hypothetical protein